MTTDSYKQEFIDAVTKALGELTGATVSVDEIDALAKRPKDFSKGLLALPIFKFAGKAKMKPPELGDKLAEVVNERLGSAITVESVSGFLNLKVNREQLTQDIISAVIGQESKYGNSDLGAGKQRLVEYSSPNIAKPFGVGHLRSTIIGHSLRRIFKKLGFDALGLNYPGDWGTQFGKMIVAFRKWGRDIAIENHPHAIHLLLQYYVKFHTESEKDEALNEEARAAFKDLEDGDPQAVKLWTLFSRISTAECNRIYDLLGVEFDHTYGESFLNDKMDAMIDRLEKAGLTSISKGALVVDLGDGDDRPPVLLRKGDGATLYATRDLAGVAYRLERFAGFDECLYVVNTAQSDYFKQIFKVIAMLEEAEGVPEDKRMAGRLKHVDFGWVTFEGSTMSTRSGRTILLEKVIDEATEKVRAQMREKNPDLPNADEVASQVGIGAVMFSQLSVRRRTDIDFRWEEVLSFEGESGPYLQYTHARLCSLQRKYESEYGQPINAEIDIALLLPDEEQRVVDLLADFPDVVKAAGEQYEPHFITTYLFKLSAAYNSVYQRKTSDGAVDRIISDNAELTAARMALVKSVQTVLKEGLYLLGLAAPKEM